MFEVFSTMNPVKFDEIPHEEMCFTFRTLDRLDVVTCT
jgi:hypothetical protein